MISQVLRTILHFRRLLLPVVAGVAVASAVIVGALIVGDSVRGSLRFIALDRIGKIDRILLAPRWFDSQLLKRVDSTNDVGLLIMQQATAQKEWRVDGKKSTLRSNDMVLFGVNESFWKLGTSAPRKLPKGEQVVLNRSLAEALDAEIGQKITFKVASQAVVPADSALGKRDQDIFVLPRWEVIDIVDDQSLGRFSLRSDQRPTFNAFVDLASLQETLEIGVKVNAIASSASSESPSQSSSILDRFAPTLDDLGLKLERVKVVAPESETEVLDYVHLTTDQMLLSDKVIDPLLDQIQAWKPQPILTYLANGVEKLSDDSETKKRRNVPYSTISGVDKEFLKSLLEKSSRDSADNQSGTAVPKALSGSDWDRLGDDWVVVNQWLAAELGLQVGDRLRLDYFLPETVEGEEIEKRFEATVAAIAPLTEPSKPYKGKSPPVYDKPPTPFNDAAWTPVVPGITDQESISKWETPFPLRRTIETQDDDYWNAHRLTPKLFISNSLARRLFGSRFGNTTSIRLEQLSQQDEEKVRERATQVAVQQLPALGWREIPIRQQQLMRSGGTTPFDALFMSLSFFLIAAALLLVVLLFRLSIERRAEHWGLMAATGWTRGAVQRSLLIEGSVLAGMGATLGVGLGIGYAYAMLALLKSWWIGAITVSFLDFYVKPTSLVLGWLGSWLAAIAAILFATKRIRKAPIALLLKGRMEEVQWSTKKSTWSQFAVYGCAATGLATLIAGRGMQGQAQAGAFVGGGMLFMVSGLLLIWSRLRTPQVNQSSMLSDLQFASSNAMRSPSRSILAIALVAIASFLILSMSLFQASPSEPGMGGFTLLGKSTSPIHAELGNSSTQKEAMGEDAKLLRDVSIVSFRLRGGDDASCNNLYQANEPQVVGVSPRIVGIDRDDEGRSRFAWFQSTTVTGEDGKPSSPWAALETKGTGSPDNPIPVILDQNTALWALHLGGYLGETFHYTLDDHDIYFKTVGVLQNTILQGGLLIGEANFEQAFPSITGYRMFLVRAPGSSSDSVQQIKMLMENAWEEPGLSLVKTEQVLSQLLAVQNTYLSAFQLLGTLGLFLGTIGLGVSQLRGALERQGELAAMRAIGFTKSRLVWLLALENAWQLGRGMIVGGAAAALATIPALLSGQPYSGLWGPIAMLLWIVLFGTVTSWLAAWAAMRWPLLQSLRADR